MTVRSRLIRLASELPVGDPQRRRLLAMADPDSDFAKVALKKDTEAFIAWALQKDDRVNSGQVQRFIEKVTGKEPIQPAEAPKPRRGPLTVGEKVLVDNYRNGNPLNTEACEEYHDQVGVIDSSTPDGVTVRFDNGQTAYFEGTGSGKATGLYRWTPKADYQEGTGAGKTALIEMVYLRGGTTPPPQRDIDALMEYVERGMARGEARSDIYYTGYVGKFAYNKQGEVYFTLSSQQRDRPTSINPKKGKVLYIGYAGRRPGGWMDDARSMGITV